MNQIKVTSPQKQNNELEFKISQFSKGEDIAMHIRNLKNNDPLQIKLSCLTQKEKKTVNPLINIEPQKIYGKNNSMYLQSQRNHSLHQQIQNNQHESLFSSNFSKKNQGFSYLENTQKDYRNLINQQKRMISFLDDKNQFSNQINRIKVESNSKKFNLNFDKFDLNKDQFLYKTKKSFLN